MSYLPHPASSYTGWVQYDVDNCIVKPEFAGIYLLCAPATGLFDIWNVLYVGSAVEQTIAERAKPGHEKWLAAKQMGMTTLFALPCFQATILNVEAFLIQGLSPPLNVQHNPNPPTGVPGLSSLF